MIISRTPLRMSFVGGGSDINTFYKEHSGAVISTAIDQYVYINLHKSFSGGVRLAYSKVEEVAHFDEIAHPLVRGAAKLTGIKNGLEITSIADIPSRGSGLGSSSSFSVGLLHALRIYNGDDVTKYGLAEQACKLEIELCSQPIGKQDQYAASFGGFNIFRFSKDDTVQVENILMSEESKFNFHQNMMVFYTGNTRSASEILSDQKAKMCQESVVSIMLEMVDLVEPFKGCIQKSDIRGCGELLDLNWHLKKQLSNSISSDNIDKIYETARAAGAYGGKLLGAGGSGFFLFLVPPKNQKKVASALSSLQRVFWNFDSDGTSIIYRR